MNLIFMGTPEFAVPTLNELISRHNVLAVVSQPDKVNARGNKTVYSPVKKTAIKSDIEILQPKSAFEQDFISRIESYKPDVIVVSAFGKLLPPAILRIPRFGCLNIHASLLPKYRGAAPIQWAIINGDIDTGVTIMYMNDGLDTGDMIRKRHVVIEPFDTYGTLSEKLSYVGTVELLGVLDDISEGNVCRIIQNDAEATYAPIIKKETGHIDWNSNGCAIVNLVRALNPSPGAFCDLAGDKLKIWCAEVYEKSDEDSDFGTILDVIPSKGVVVNAAEQSVILTELQIGGSRKMQASDFLRGRKVEKGISLR